MRIHTNCCYYRGDVPCAPHKLHGVHCAGCEYYEKIGKRILIIKLGAIGDVIRTTPLLRKLKDIYPDSQIHWLTHTPEVLPSVVEYSYKYNLKNLEILKQTPFDYLFSLDKDREACSLANVVQSKIKKGFHLVDGFCQPIDDDAKSKWITGLFDDKSIKNTRSYPEEIFEICGFEYHKEEYILEVKENNDWDIPKGKEIIGLNTGCGERWQTRLWPEEHWITLSKMLKKKGYEVVLLGGPQEDEKNKSISRKANVIYPGHFPVPIFIDLMNQCHLVVTAVTMALHIALGLKKKVVLFNNIFNRHEFEMFGRGVILEPPKNCKGCYKSACDEACMELITPEEVAANIGTLLK